MRFLHSLLFFAALSGATAITASANSYIYTVNDQYAGFSVTGTITTDTNTGVLASRDITGYSLTLNDGSQSLLITPLNSMEAVIGNGLTATAASLDFNFSGLLGNQFILENPYIGSTVNYLCYQDNAGGCDSSGPAHESIQLGSDTRSVQALAGDLPIALAATPEPGSLALFGTGLLGTVGVLRRRLIA